MVIEIGGKLLAAIVTGVGALLVIEWWRYATASRR